MNPDPGAAPGRQAADHSPRRILERYRLDRSPQTVWATPLQALLAAERTALLTGRDEDFTMVITIAYTGLRWGETIGLERDFAHADEIHVEWQLREIRSTFHRLPPKNDSYRSPEWQPCLPVDLPPFLAGLLAYQLRDQSWQRCACAGQHGGSGQYVFLGPDGTPLTGRAGPASRRSARRPGRADGETQAIIIPDDHDPHIDTGHSSEQTSGTPQAARIRRRRVLGGLIHEYKRAA